MYGLVLGLFCCSFLAAEDAPQVILEQSNSNFRKVYQEAKESALKTVGPIIIAKGDFVVLLYNGQRTEVQYIPQMYHQLKAVDHIPLMLYILLLPYEEGSLLTQAQKADLQEILDKVVVLRGSLTPDPQLAEIQESCLAATATFLEELLVCDKVNKEQHAQFFREIAPILLANAQEAAFLQLDALHHQVQSWKSQIPEEEWNRLAAIVMGPSMPRIGEVTMQYFSRLTGKSLEVLGAKSYAWLNSKLHVKPSKQHRKLVYAENIATEEDALNLLATHIMDEGIGKAFFDDNMRMHCDLLAEAASRRLEEKCDGGK
jgi:hypothetical protein